MKILAAVIIFFLTGACVLKGQVVDSGYISKPDIRSRLFVPLALMVSGFSVNGNSSESIKYEIAEERAEHIPGFSTKIDNYLQYSPIAIAYVLDVFGVQSKNDMHTRTAILFKGELIMIATVSLMKYGTHQLRPDGSGYNSFPSGHTAQAFAAATFLSEEYKHKIPWIPYVNLLMALY